MLSWFGAIDLGYDREVRFPYHIPTLNMSIKTNFLRKKKIKFNNKLKTGEDLQFCKDVRKAKGKILSISNSSVFHNDRKNFKEVFEHQSNWGRHQFYTFYKFVHSERYELYLSIHYYFFLYLFYELV